MAYCHGCFDGEECQPHLRDDNVAAALRIHVEGCGPPSKAQARLKRMASRRLEILIDYIALHSRLFSSHLLSGGYQEHLSTDEQVKNVTHLCLYPFVCTSYLYLEMSKR